MMPKLAEIQARVAAVPFSTAGVERTFNGLHKVLADDRKGKLSEETAQAELFVRTSLAFNYNFKK